MKRLMWILPMILLLAGCGKEKENRDSVSIWYVEGECPAAFIRLTEQYNAELQEGLLLRGAHTEVGLA